MLDGSRRFLGNAFGRDRSVRTGARLLQKKDGRTFFLVTVWAGCGAARSLSSVAASWRSSRLGRSATLLTIRQLDLAQEETQAGSSVELGRGGTSAVDSNYCKVLAVLAVRVLSHSHAAPTLYLIAALFASPTARLLDGNCSGRTTFRLGLSRSHRHTISVW